MNPFDAQLPTVLRPHPNLMKLFAISSLAFGPLFPIALVPFYFKYHTLRYELDDEGITMRWGILFRREVSLTYARIQDIHLLSNVVERWLGLARIQVQTASGSSSAEMVIQGIREYEAMRDFLYSRMRGARQARDPVPSAAASATAHAAAEDGELASVLREVAAELRALRAVMPGARDA